MLIPLSWLRRYCDVDVPADELAHRLTMAGVEVESIERIGAHLDPALVVVGEVVAVDPHPNADRLRLPTVRLGDGETARVVCGAPNVAAGQRIAFARLGARLVNPRSGREEPLRAASIRGVESSGMVCSERELGLGDDHEGILVLADDAEVGTPLADVVGDVILDVAVTPNRPDCLSVLGVAREAAALTGRTVAEPALDYPEDGEPIEGRVRVEIADPALCRRYTASLIEGVSIGPSPPWLRDVLARAGQRPINNVVDVTNFVMLELNQPLHAFDFDLVREATIIVRQARDGEEMRTLDGRGRRLRPPMLVIADPSEAVGLAGVMGGASTEVSDGTTRILLESANFDPVNTRRTGADLGLSTGASYRFERGLRAALAEIGLRRATRLIAEVAGGRVAAGIVDVHPGAADEPALGLREGRLRQVLGADIPIDRAGRVLSSLGFEVAPGDGGSVSVRAPYWRSDVSMEDDLVEEVARVIGYDEMPTTMLSAPVPHHRPRPAWDLKERLRDALVAAGMHEVITYNVVSEEALRAVGGWRDDALALANPMNEEQRHLRTTLRAGILGAVADNARHAGGEGVRIFEIGRVFVPDGAGPGDLPDERESLALALSGRRLPAWWAGGGDERMDLFDAKGAVADALGRLGVRPEFEPVEDPALRTGRAAAVLAGGERLGTLGELSHAAAAALGMEGTPVALAEIDLGALAAAMPAQVRRYAPFSRYPESARDLALLVDSDVPAERMRSTLAAHKLVRSATALDVYTGAGVPEGKKSIAFGLVLQSEKGTLTSEQVDRVVADLLRRLGREVGAELRA